MHKKNIFTVHREINNGWVFSLKEDFILYIIVFISLFILGKLAQITSLREFGITPILVLGVCFDMAHVLATYFLCYCQLKIPYKSYLVIPLICLLCIVFMKTLGFSIANLIIVLSLIHFIRQQYGILMCTLRKGRKMKLWWEAKLNQFFFYNLMLTPIIYFTFHPQLYFQWAQRPINLITPIWSPTIILAIFFIILFCQAVFELREYKKYKSINLSKLFHSIMCSVLWFAMPYYLNGWNNITASLLIIQHAIFYFYFCYKKVLRNNKEGSKYLRDQYLPKMGILGSYIILICITFLYIKLRKMNTIPAVQILFFVVLINHYILDGFIWKGKDIDTKAIS